MGDPAAKSGSTLPSLFRKDGIWATRVAFYLLWFEYLAISPSYELARRFRAGLLSDDEKARLPEDFSRVLEVYDALGDVQRQHFKEWWSERGINVFGYQGERPRVRRIAAISRKSDRHARLATASNEYIDSHWESEGRQNTLVVAVPIHLTKHQIGRQMEKLLSKYTAEQKELKTKPIKYPLAKKRLDKKSLFRYIKLVWIRAKFPEFENWRIGALAKLSATYSGRLNGASPDLGDDNSDDRMRLKILTSRALYRARMIAENAARGTFPSYENCQHGLEFDLENLYHRIESRWKWQELRRQVEAKNR